MSTPAVPTEWHEVPNFEDESLPEWVRDGWPNYWEWSDELIACSRR